MFKKFFNFLALKKSVGAILLTAVLLEHGEKIGERYLPVYIIALGGSSIVVGLLNAMDNFLSALYSIPGGYLSDRIGYKKSLMLFNLLASAGYLVIVFFPSWQAAIIGAVLFISWSSTSMPAIMSALSKILPFEKRTMGVSMHAIARRIPKALGPIVGGAFIMWWGEINGVRMAFLAAFVLSVFSMFAQVYMVEEPKEKEKAKFSFSRIFTLINPRLKPLLVSDVLIRFCEQIPYAFVVIWCMNHLGMSAIQFGFLSAVEMATAMAVYVPVAYMVERSRSKKKFVAVTFLFFSLFPLVILYSEGFGMLVFAFIVRGLKEFGEPTRKAMILDFSDDSSKATTYGTYYFVRDLIVAFAAFGGGVLWGISPRMTFVVAMIFGLAGTAYFLKFAKEEPPETSQNPSA